MNKTKQTILIVVLLLGSMLVLGACNASRSIEEGQATNQESSTNGSTAEQQEASGEIPEYLPTDFPLPDDAKITTSHSSSDDGKKAALLIFETSASMADVTEMYKEYFKRLGDGAETIDDKNIIIQGIDEERKHDWSVIGGALSDRAGIIELTVTWAER